jgi:hypothetical protein
VPQITAKTNAHLSVPRQGPLRYCGRFPEDTFAKFDSEVSVLLGDSVAFGYITQAGHEYGNPDNFVGFPDYVGNLLRLDVQHGTAECEPAEPVLVRRASKSIGPPAHRAGHCSRHRSLGFLTQPLAAVGPFAVAVVELPSARWTDLHARFGLLWPDFDEVVGLRV